MASADVDEDELLTSEVERRREPRGIIEGLTLSFEGTPYPVVEASRRGFFLSAPDPDTIALGRAHSAVLAHVSGQLALKIEVVRKEIQPRCGIGVRIVGATPAAEETLSTMLAASEVPRES